MAGVNGDDYWGNFLLDSPTDQGQNPQQQFGGSAGTNGLFQSSSTLGFSAPSMINQGSPAAFGTQPCPEQQLGQAPGANGCVAGAWINQGQGNQAAAATQSLMAQQHSGQISAPDSPDRKGRDDITSDKKRKWNKEYRERQKKQKLDLVDENGRLKEEKQQMEYELEASEKEKQELEVENGKLKDEKQQMNSKLEASENQKQELVDENGRLKEEKQQMEYKLEASEKEKQELVVENGKLKDEKQQMEYKLEASEVKEQQMKSNLEPKLQIEWLRDEVDSLKKDNACVNQRMQTQSRELALLQNKFNKFELKQQNGALPRPQSLTTPLEKMKTRKMQFGIRHLRYLANWNPTLAPDSDQVRV